MIDELDDLLNEDEDSAKAELDTDELTASLPGDSQKVELDLEDAPFLEEDEEEEDEELPEETAAPVALEEPKEETPPWYKQKRIVIPAAAAVLLAVVGLVIWFYARPTPPPVEETLPEPEAIEIETEVPAIEEEVQEFIVSLNPFVVEIKGEDGKIHFLQCRFAAITDSERLSFEVTQKTTTLRDAIFYYLSNKSYAYLSDMKNADALKADLLSVINQYLSTGRVEVLLIEEYLVK